MKKFMKKYSANKEMPIFEYFSSKRNKPNSAFFIVKSIYIVGKIKLKRNFVNFNFFYN
jgi:hypothetical protein